jgi:hypothetical protein
MRQELFGKALVTEFRFERLTSRWTSRDGSQLCVVDPELTADKRSGGSLLSTLAEVFLRELKKPWIHHPHIFLC